MSDKKPSAQPTVDNHRRRILQGAIGVPMVLTVSNASAQAAASALQCRAVTPADAGTECLADGNVVASGVTAADGTTFTHAGDTGTALRAFNSSATAPEQNCIAYIKEDGSYYFATDSGASGGVAVTASCYTSFVP